MINVFIKGSAQTVVNAQELMVKSEALMKKLGNQMNIKVRSLYNRGVKLMKYFVNKNLK